MIVDTAFKEEIVKRFLDLGGYTELDTHEEYRSPTIHRKPVMTSLGTPYFRQPGVVMLARPHVATAPLRGFVEGFDEELEFNSYIFDPDMLSPAATLTKVAGQTCYLSLGPGRTKNADADRYLTNIKAQGHGSVLEHSSFSFLLYGCSRSFTHELVRHRTGVAFSQVSQRYVGGKTLRFVERREYQSSPVLHDRFERGIDLAATEYAGRTDILLALQKDGDLQMTAEARTDRRKKVQQAARSCLPNETEAPLVFSGNVRALRHIIEMRTSQHAETEIRDVMYRVFLCLAIAEPLLFNDYKIVDLPDGTCEVTTPYRKV